MIICINYPTNSFNILPNINRQIIFVADNYIEYCNYRTIKINTNNIDNLIRYTTLIPYQHYKFYIHFVKDNGEVTNGYYCSGKRGVGLAMDVKEKMVRRAAEEIGNGNVVKFEMAS